MKALEELIQRVQGDLRQGRFPSEAAISQGVVLPLLDKLGIVSYPENMGVLEDMLPVVNLSYILNVLILPNNIMTNFFLVGLLELIITSRSLRT